LTATQLEALVELLASADVEFVVVGGLAAVVHGSAYVTNDVDVCYGRSAANVERLCRVLSRVHPTLRGAPKDLPFRLDPPTVAAGLNFTLDTDLGALDLLGEMQGLGGYAEAAEHSEVVELFGRSVRVLTLEALIRAKRAAGRRKDLLLLPELEALLELRKSPSG
jgi:predicted nucleotidyltransferase